MLEKGKNDIQHISVCMQMHACHILFCILEVSPVAMPTAFVAVTDSVHPELGGSLSMY